MNVVTPPWNSDPYMYTSVKLIYSYYLPMDKIYENCLRRIMILKAKRKMNVATEEEKELIEQLDLFLDCFETC